MLIIRSTNNAPVVKPKIISSTTYDESRYIFFWKCLAMHWHWQLIQSYFLDLEPMLASSQENPQKFVIKKIITNLKLLLLLFLQQFQFPELLLPKVVFIVERLILFIAINDFGCSCSNNNAIYLEFPRAFSRFLFQIHFGNVFLG